MKKQILSALLALCALQPTLAMEWVHNLKLDDSSSCQSSDDESDSSDLSDFETGLLKSETPHSELEIAAFEGNFAKCKELIQNGAAINKQQAFTQRTALHFAASAGHITVVKLLLLHGANPHLGCYGTGMVEVNGKKEEYTGLVICPEDLAQKNGHTQITHILMRHKEMLLQFYAACAQGDLTTCESLLRKYRIANVPNKCEENAFQTAAYTPLILAAAHGHLDVCTLLLEHGAHPELTDEEGLPLTAKSIGLFGERGRTALKYAQRAGHTEVVNLLTAVREGKHPKSPLSLQQLCANVIADMIAGEETSPDELQKQMPSDILEKYF